MFRVGLGVFLGGYRFKAGDLGACIKSFKWIKKVPKKSKAEEKSYF